MRCLGLPGPAHAPNLQPPALRQPITAAYRPTRPRVAPLPTAWLLCVRREHAMSNPCAGGSTAEGCSVVEARARTLRTALRTARRRRSRPLVGRRAWRLERRRLLPRRLHRLRRRRRRLVLREHLLQMGNLRLLCGEGGTQLLVAHL